MKYCKYCGKKLKEGCICKCKLNKEHNPNLFIKKEKEKIIKEPKIKKEKIKKEKKRINFNFKILLNKKVYITASVVLVLLCVSFGTYKLFFDNKKEEYVKIALTEKGELYLTEVKKNVTFKIKYSEDSSSSSVSSKEKATYTITNEEDKEILTNLIEKDGYFIIKNKENYEEGKTYTLTLNNYDFVDEEYKQSNVLVFKIEKKEVIEYDYQKEVKKVAKKNISVTKDSITTKDKYEKGDVILIEDKKTPGNTVAYKVSEVNSDGTYKIEEPTLTDIYEDINVYDKRQLDISEFIVSDEAKEQLGLTAYAALKENKNYDWLMMNVHAAELGNIEINNLSGGRTEIVIPIVISPIKENTSIQENKTKFSLFSKHVFTFTIKFVYDMELESDLNLLYRELAVNGTIDTSFELSIKPVDLKMQQFFTDYGDADKYTEKDLTELFKDSNMDTNKQRALIGYIPILTPVPGVALEINAYTLFEFSFLIDFNVNYSFTKYYNTGYRKYNVPFTPYIKYTNTNETEKNPTITFEMKGKASLKIGAILEINTSLYGWDFFTLGVESGFYGETSFGAKKIYNIIDNKIEPQMNIYLKAEAGLFLNAYFKIFDIEKLTFNFYDQKLPLWEYSDEKTSGTRTIKEKEALKILAPVDEDEMMYLTPKSTNAQSYIKNNIEKALCNMVDIINPKKNNLSYDTIDSYMKKRFGKEIKYTIPDKFNCDFGSSPNYWQYSKTNKTLVFKQDSNEWGVGYPGGVDEYIETRYKYYNSAFEKDEYIYIIYNVLIARNRYTEDEYGMYNNYAYTDLFTNIDKKTKIKRLTLPNKYKNTYVSPETKEIYLSTYKDSGDTVVYKFKKGKDEVTNQEYYTFIETIVEASK